MYNNVNNINYYLLIINELISILIDYKFYFQHFSKNDEI